MGSLFRVGFFLAVACAMASALLVRSVHADVRELLWEAGAKMMEYPGSQGERVRRLELNGVRVSFRTQTMDTPFADVLDYYQALCGNLAIATQTARGDSAGYVACLDMGDAPLDLDELAGRVLSFSQTGDLQEVGDLRYVLARRIASSSGNKTFLLSMWADSDVNLYRMLPHAGADAAGQDPVGVPRLVGSQRILSALEAGRPSGVFVYRVVGKSAQDIESFYRSELSKDGWMVIERNPSESIEVDGVRMLSAEKNNRLITLLSDSGEASATRLTILASEPS